MKEFYQGRLKTHQNKLLRYLKYVLNDHIVLIGSFIFGGAALYYADVVKSLDASFIFGKPLLILLWFLMLFAGNLATLLQPADKVFLLPKEGQMPAYLKAAFRHSLFIPFSLLILTAGISMPLLIAINGATILDFILLTSLLLVLKGSHLIQQGQTLFQGNQVKARQTKIIWALSSLVLLALSLYLSNWFALALSLPLLSYQLIQLKAQAKFLQLDWEGMIASEQQRMKRIYQFINLFTDVPGISGKIKRRKIFDPVLNQIPLVQKQTYTYLYSRSFIRGSEYSQLVLRLVLVGGIITALANQFLVVLLTSLAIIYLIGFQLLPMYSQFDYMVMTQLYPLSKKDQQRAFSRLILIILSVVAVILAIIAFIVVPTWLDKGLVALALLIEVILFSQIYTPSRLRKMERRMQI